MKKFLTILLLSTLFFSVISCSDENLDEKENVVELIITTDDPSAKLTVNYTYKCTGSYYEKSRTKNYEAGCIVYCDDPYVNITVQIRVNGKKRAENKGTLRVGTECKLK